MARQWQGNQIPRSTLEARFLPECKSIIWAEVPMADGDGFCVLDEVSRDIMGIVDNALSLVPFGGKTVLMTGDWRRILPVVPRGSRATVITSSLKKSYLWPSFKNLRLSTNICVHGTCQNQTMKGANFANGPLDVGQGNMLNPLPIPCDMR